MFENIKAEVKYIDIVFENVESITIPIDRFYSFDAGTLREASFYGKNYIDKNVYETDYISFSIIFDDAEDLNYNPSKYDEPLGMYVGNPLSNNVEDRPEILGRILNCNDIASIDILDSENKSLASIYVPWNDEDQWNNSYMSYNVCLDQGILKVEINKNADRV